MFPHGGGEMTNREDTERVDNAIHTLLVNLSTPEVGLTVRDMTRQIFNYKGKGTTEEFYTDAKFLERRIGAVRHHIFEIIRRDMKLRDEEMKKTKVEVKVKRPKFIPYALADGKYWKYFNAANFEEMKWVIKGLRKKADGLNSNAEVLEEIFDDN